jgi:putative flippase GtrA
MALLAKLVRYGGVSVLSLVLNVGGAWTLYTVVGLVPELAYAISLATIFVVNFLLFRHWVFRDTTGPRRPARRQFGEFFATTAAFRGSEYACFLLLHSLLRLDPTLAIVGISCVFTVLKFAVFNLRTFSSPDEGADVPAGPTRSADAGGPGFYRLPRWRGWIVPLLAAALAGGGLCYQAGPILVRAHVTSGDAAQHLFWAQQAWSADLLALDPATGEPRDPIAAYFASDAQSVPAWRFIATTMARFGDVVFVAEVVNIAVMLLTAGLMYRLGRSAGMGDAWSGLLAAGSLPVLLYLMDWFPYALLQRSLGPPIVVLGAIALLERRLWLLGVSFVLAGLLYPIIIISLGLTAVFHETWRLIPDRRLPAGWWIATLGGVIGLVLVLVVRNPPAAYGPMITSEAARQMPIFGPYGRTAIWVEGWQRFFFEHHRTGLRLPVLHTIAFTLLAVLAIWIGGIRRVPVLAWTFLAAGLLLFVASHLLLFDLYLPNRHVAFSIPLAFFLATVPTLPHAARRLSTGLRLTRRWRARIAYLAACGVLAYLVIFGVDRLRNRDEPPAMAGAVHYLRQTPPDTRLAGLPVDAEVDHLPYRTGRSILVNYETVQAYYPDFYREVMLPRVVASVRMHYSPDWAQIDRIADEHDIDIVFWRAHTLKALPREEPMRTIARQVLGETDAATPAMYQPPEDRLIWWNGDVRLIRVGTRNKPLPAPEHPAPPFPELPPVDATMQALLAEPVHPDIPAATWWR